MAQVLVSGRKYKIAEFFKIEFLIHRSIILFDDIIGIVGSRVQELLVHEIVEFIARNFAAAVSINMLE